MRGGWTTPADVAEREHELILKIDLPEMNQSEIEIKDEENTLIIQGERKFVKEIPDENYVQIERPYGSFHRTFTLSRRIDQESIRASYKDGVLRIVLSKREVARPQKILLEES